MKENFYHGMLLGLLQNQDSWLVKSNAETEKDTAISPSRRRIELAL